MADKTYHPLKIFEQKLVVNANALSGNDEFYFRVVSGSRMLVTLTCTAIDSGAQLDVFVEDSISTDDAYLPVSPGFGITAAGTVKRVYSDFNPLIRIRVSASSGAATFKVAVVLYDNASTTRIENAQLSVDLSDITDSLGHFDSLRIGDGSGFYLDINEDGSINVKDDLASDETPVNPYDESPAVPPGVQTTVLSFTVPADKIAFLYRAESAGENIARHRVLVNGIPVATKRTYFGGDLNATFEFGSPNKRQVILQPGDLVEVTVIHDRPWNADFEARLQLLLKDEP